MKKDTWNKLGVIAALMIAVPIIGSTIVQTVAIWHLPERVSKLENRFDNFDAKLNGIAPHVVCLDTTNRIAVK